MFDYLVLKPEDALSDRVQEAGFFFVTDFREVYDNLIDYQIDEAPLLQFTMRDAIVLYTVVHLSQKLCISDAGKRWMAVFEEAAAQSFSQWSSARLRNFCIGTGVSINAAILSKLSGKEAFDTYTGMVADFIV